MRRRSAAALALALVALATGSATGTARADEGTDPKTGFGKSAATVGIRTANASGGDDRGAYDYEVLPRGVVQDWVAVSNFRYQPITVRLFAKDATTTADSTFAVQQSAEKPGDVGAWIALKKNRITIPARSEIVVPFQLGVPFNATPGDHAGAIVVSLLAREPKPEGGSIIVDHRVGMRLHLRVPGALKPQLTVDDLSVDWNGEGDVLGRGDAVVTYTVRNTGNVRMSATGDLQLSRVLALPSVNAKVPPIEDMLPGGSTTVRTTVKNVFGTGPMKANVRLHGKPVDPALSDKADDVTAARSFPAWPLLLIAIVAALMILSLVGGWYERRRRKARALRGTSTTQPAQAGKHAAELLVRAALLALVAGFLLAPPASAAKGDVWQAKLSQKEGAAGDPFDLLASGGCPAPATNVVGFGYGSGFPKAGAVVVSNTSAGVSDELPFQIPVLDSMANLMLMQSDPKPLKGVYRFALRCIEAEWPDRSLGEYVVAIRFDRPDHWRVQPPLTRRHGPALAPSHGPDGEPPGGVSEPDDSSTAGEPEGGNKAGSGQATGESSADRQAAQERAEVLLNGSGASQSGSGGNGVSWPLMAAGVGVLVAVGLFLIGKLPLARRRTGT